jgi:uncharacterized membrane protein YfcA
MDVTLEILLFLLAAAGIAGFIDAMAGGGGLITLPALLAAGVPTANALATNKLQSSFGSFSATLYFVRSGLVSLKEMRMAIACTFIGAAVGATAVQVVDATLLNSLIPLLLIAISLYFLLSSSKPQLEGSKQTLSEGVFALTVGTSIGFYDGFFGPGTGALFTVCFVALGKLNLIHATAKTKVLNFTSNISALLFFLMSGLVLWKVGLTMAVGQFVGARLGAKVVVTKGQKWIRPLVIMMSLLMAFKLLWQQHHEQIIIWLG